MLPDTSIIYTRANQQSIYVKLFSFRVLGGTAYYPRLQTPPSEPTTQAYMLMVGAYL